MYNIYKPTILAPIWSNVAVIDDAMLRAIFFGVCKKESKKLSSRKDFLRFVAAMKASCNIFEMESR